MRGHDSQSMHGRAMYMVLRRARFLVETVQGHRNACERRQRGTVASSSLGRGDSGC